MTTQTFCRGHQHTGICNTTANPPGDCHHLPPAPSAPSTSLSLPPSYHLRGSQPGGALICHPRIPTRGHPISGATFLSRPLLGPLYPPLHRAILWRSPSKNGWSDRNIAGVRRIEIAIVDSGRGSAARTAVLAAFPGRYPTHSPHFTAIHQRSWGRPTSINAGRSIATGLLP